MYVFLCNDIYPIDDFPLIGSQMTPALEAETRMEPATLPMSVPPRVVFHLVRAQMALVSVAHSQQPAAAARRRTAPTSNPLEQSPGLAPSTYADAVITSVS